MNRKQKQGTLAELEKMLEKYLGIGNAIHEVKMEFQSALIKYRETVAEIEQENEKFVEDFRKSAKIVEELRSLCYPGDINAEDTLSLCNMKIKAAEDFYKRNLGYICEIQATILQCEKEIKHVEEIRQSWNLKQNCLELLVLALKYDIQNEDLKDS